jgi:hypothetical protein
VGNGKLTTVVEIRLSFCVLENLRIVISIAVIMATGRILASLLVSIKAADPNRIQKVLFPSYSSDANK